MSDDSVDSLIRHLENLRLQEALVLQRLIAARQRENSEINQPEREAFRIGGRVKINNPKPRTGRALNENDARAIISKVTPSRNINLAVQEQLDNCTPRSYLDRR